MSPSQKQADETGSTLPEGDQPGQERGDARIVPFPGATQPPDVPAGAEVEPAPEVFEAELVDEQDYAGRSGLQRYVPPPLVVVVQRVVVVVTPRTASAGKATLRVGVTIGQGLGSWLRRGYDAATLGVYRQEIQAARAAGDHERVADWITRHQQAKQQRHRRLVDAPKTAVGVAIVAGICLVGAVVLVAALAVQLTGVGEFLAVLAWVRDALGWCLIVAPWVLAGLLVLGPPLVVRAAWREGMRTGTVPK